VAIAATAEKMNVPITKSEVGGHWGHHIYLWTVMFILPKNVWIFTFSNSANVMKGSFIREGKIVQKCTVIACNMSIMCFI
jgi:hypothetical protein